MNQSYKSYYMQNVHEKNNWFVKLVRLAEHRSFSNKFLWNLARTVCIPVGRLWGSQLVTTLVATKIVLIFSPALFFLCRDLFS